MKLVKFALTPPIVAISVALFAALSSFGTTYYVDYKTGNDGNDGTTAPWKTLAYAVSADSGVVDNDEIILAKGTHTVAADITVGKKLHIHGEGENWETLLDWNHNGKYVYVKAEGALLNNFTVYRLTSAYQNDVVQIQANATLSNLVFRSCGNSSGNNQRTITMTTGLFTDCYFTNNIGYNHVGIYCAGKTCNAVIQNSVFAYNELKGSNGSGNIFDVRNENSVKVRNCTIAHNILKGGKPAVYSYWNSSVWSNNIIYDNKDADKGEEKNVGSSAGTWIANCTTPMVGTAANGNIAADPVFKADGLHLASDSPCKTAGRANAADKIYATEYDLDGVKRGNPPAMGAYEFVQAAELELKPMASATFARLPDVIQLSVQVEGAVGGLLYAWDFDGDGQIDSTEAEPVLDEAGFYTPSVTVTDTETKASKTVALDGEYYVHQAAALVRHVDFSGGDDDDGDGTQEKPFKTIPAALADKWLSVGDEIRLAAGTHEISSSVVIDKGVALIGSGEGVTILDGCGACVKITLAAAGAALRDLTAMNFGNGSDKLGYAFALQKNSLISNVTFTACRPYSGLVDVAWGTFQDCFVTNNTGVSSVAINLSGSGTQALIENSAFVGNAVTSGSGGAIFNFSQQTKVQVRNCTIAHNKLKNKKPAVYCYWSTVEIDNSIVCFNVDQDDSNEYNWSAAAGTSTATWDCNCTSPIAGLDGAGNFEGDPLFKKDNLHLQKTSPCIGVANPVSATAYDLDGVLRGDTPGVGAFEFVKTSSLELTPVASSTFARLPATITLSCGIEGAVGEVSYAWDFDGDGEVDSTEATPEITTAGFYTPSVTVTDEKGQVETESVPTELYVHVAETLVRYVDANKADPADPGDGSYDNPYLTAAAAFGDKTIAAGDEIVYKKGVHMLKKSVVVSKAVTVRGEGTNAETVLAGDGSVNTGLSIPLDGAMVHSLTVSNACMIYSSYAALNLAGESVVSNVVFTGNFSGYPDSDTYNGRQPIYAKAGLVTGCWITNNLPFGLLVNVDGHAVFENCYIAGNRNRGAAYAGCVLSVGSANTIIRNCTIVDNEVSLDGALSTSVGNKFYNNILKGNTNFKTGAEANWSIGGSQTSTAGWIGNCTTTNGLKGGSKNIEADPLLTAGSPEIPVSSPCRNKGDDTLGATASVDILGNPRRVGRHIDIGCAECQNGPGLGILVR